MKLAKVQSVVLTHCISQPDMPILRMYLEHFEQDDNNCFICKVVEVIRGGNQKPVLDIRLALEDYLFNEPESEGVWPIAEKLIGERKIDLKVLNIVTL